MRYAGAANIAFGLTGAAVKKSGSNLYVTGLLK